MTKARKLYCIPMLALASLVMTSGQVSAKTQSAPTCVKCHQADANTLYGFLKGGSQTDSSFAVETGGDAWDIAYNKDTKLAKNLTTIKELANGKIVMVKFKEEGGKAVATEVSYKTPAGFTKPENTIEVDELIALLKQNPKEANYALLDVRGISNFQESHLPGAVAVPNYRFDKYKDRLPKDKDTMLVTYCNGYGCGMSPSMLRTLTEGLGYTKVKSFSGGMPLWAGTSQPMYTEPEFLKYLQDNGKPDSYVLVDVRSPEQAAKEHIAGAVNLPGTDAKAVFEAMPSDKKARIILYGNTNAETEAASRALKVNNFTDVTTLNGGMAEWKAKSYPVAANALITEVNYKKQMLPGRISVDEFKKIVEAQPADKILLDVRRPDERAKKGKVAGTINIPVDTLDWRWSELPKDKEIIIHCQDGPRASVAFDVLKEHNLKVRSLFASFNWNKDGTYEIKEK